MVTYPIRVPRERYKRSNPSKRQKYSEKNRITQELETFLNNAIKQNDCNIQVYVYGNIAIELNLPEEVVRDILFGVDCGHNGFTVALLHNS